MADIHHIGLQCYDDFSMNNIYKRGAILSPEATGYRYPLSGISAGTHPAIIRRVK